METRICTVCGQEKPLLSFAQAGKDPRYRRRKCNTCREKRKDVAKRKRRETKQNRSRSQQRAAGIEIEKFIFWDSRRSDRKAGRSHDLTKSDIKQLISVECSYCGETELRMTVDRIDNAVGHVRGNVVSACIRCNYARRSMPHLAWLIVADAMRQAREKGLFGDWTGRAR